MRETQYIHTATVTPRTHTVTSNKLVTGKGTPVPSVECRIEPISDSASASIAGISTVSVYRGFWPPDTTITEASLVTWNSKELQVTSTEEKYGREDEVQHIETLMTVSRRS